MLRADHFHGLCRQFGSQSNLAFFLIPETVSHRNRKIKDFSILVYRKKEKETDHAVSIEVIGVIMGGIIVQFETKFKMLTGFFDHHIIDEKKKRLFFQRGRNGLDCFGNSDVIPDRVIISFCFQCIIKCVKRNIRQSGDHMAVGKANRSEDVQSQNRDD